MVSTQQMAVVAAAAGLLLLFGEHSAWYTKSAGYRLKS